MLWTQIFKTRSGQGHSDLYKVCDTPQFQDATSHQIWDSYLKYYKTYAPDTIIQETRSEVKVTVTRKWWHVIGVLKAGSTVNDMAHHFDYSDYSWSYEPVQQSYVLCLSESVQDLVLHVWQCYILIALHVKSPA